MYPFRTWNGLAMPRRAGAHNSNASGSMPEPPLTSSCRTGADASSWKSVRKRASVSLSAQSQTPAQSHIPLMPYDVQIKPKRAPSTTSTLPALPLVS
jgi:hypothetical protein